jgi:P4 family phage/plasmid primase-like protien
MSGQSSGASRVQHLIEDMPTDDKGYHPFIGHGDMVRDVILPELKDMVRFVPELGQFVVRDENLIWDSTPRAGRTAVNMVQTWIMRVLDLMHLRPAARSSMVHQNYKTSVLRWLSDQEVITRHLADWDVNAWELQTPGGVVDLKWGTSRPTEMTDFNLNCTAVTPTPTVERMPVFDAMRASAFAHAPDHEEYLRLSLGASMFGDNIDHAIRWLIGTSGSGKSSMLFTVADCLGSYGTVCEGKLIAAVRDERLPLMQQREAMRAIAKARFAVADEIHKQARINSTVVKQITNNEQVVVEAKFKSPYLVEVRANMWVTANNMPAGIEGGAEGLERRMQIIEMNGLPAVDDKTLKDKLKAEHPRLLAWLVRAASDWYQHGGAVAPAMSRALVSGLTEETRLVPRWWSERWVYDGDDAHRVHMSDLWHDFSVVWWPTQPEAKIRTALTAPIIDHEFYRQVHGLIARTEAKGVDGVWSRQMMIEGVRASGFKGVARRADKSNQ